MPDRRIFGRLLATPPRRELLFFALVGGFGLIVLPFLIYVAGSRTLGPYEGGGLGSFLKNLYGDFFTLHFSAWCLLLGPYALFTALRLLTRPLRATAAPDDDDEVAPLPRNPPESRS